LKIGQPKASRWKARAFRSRQRDRQAGAQFERGVARPDHRLIAPFAPSLAARLNAMGGEPGPARLKLALDLNKERRAGRSRHARAVLDLDAPQLKGSPRSPQSRPWRRSRASISIRRWGAAKSASSRSCRRSRAARLLVLLGLDRTVAAGDGPAQFEGSATGAWARRCG
jgi:hypothetical protein